MLATGLFGVGRPAWIQMWVLSGAIYAGLKWLTFADCPGARRAAWRRTLAYLLLWPGMNAAAFFAPTRSENQPRAGEWWQAMAKLLLGLWLVFGAAPMALTWSRAIAGWLAMAGIVCVLHFGVFHVLSLVWRSAGIDAPAIMNAPQRSSSLAEFWGRRWNLAFRDVAHAWVFRPLLPRLGPRVATLGVFLVSGLVHDVAISVPAGGGWGLPTLYFVLQGAGTLIERTRRARQLGLGRGGIGRLFCGAVICLPLGMLFHAAFVERVVLPMLAANGHLLRRG